MILIAFFDLCHNGEFVAPSFHEEIRGYFTFNEQNGTFQRRLRSTTVEGHIGIFHENTLGIMYTIHLNNRECYQLRMLLNLVKRPTAFGSLKSLNGIPYPAYHAAYLALGLLESDNLLCGNIIPHYGLPSPKATEDGIVENFNKVYNERTHFDSVELQRTINENESRLNNERKSSLPITQ
ncbi:ATP-dependent DNA helicase [Trichonephila clavipes]|nr:ATP-dependent DNA helicase [Trichonephila clavipes]